MPSKAFKAFEYNLGDTDRTIETFEGIKRQGAGLGHLTRGGVVLLCAAWELYVEQLLRDYAAALTSELSLPSELPLTVQQELSRAVKSDKHDLRLANAHECYPVLQTVIEPSRSGDPICSASIRLSSDISVSHIWPLWRC